MDTTTGALTPDESEGVRDIEREIAETRRQMARTIDEIQYRLSPDHMKTVAKERMRTMAHDTSNTLMDRVRQNPGALAVTGIGLFMLFRNHDPGRHRHDWQERQYGDVTDLYCGSCGAVYVSERSLYPESSRMHGMAGEARERMHDVQERISDAGDRLSHSAHEAREKISEAGDRVRSTASHLADRSRSAANRTRQRAMRAGDAASRSYGENPFLLGAVALAAGAALGSLLPESRRERELMGEASEQLRDRASRMTREKAGEIKDAARTAAETVMREGMAEVKRQTSSQTGSEGETPFSASGNAAGTSGTVADDLAERNRTI
jgi:ElaB/YqjD/DUF883 family membrane-anchored ribosome-binding protein